MRALLAALVAVATLTIPAVAAAQSPPLPALDERAAAQAFADAAKRFQAKLDALDPDVDELGAECEPAFGACRSTAGTRRSWC